MENERLYLHFIEEAHFLEHWILQAMLNNEDNKLSIQMNKRLKWVSDQISKLENMKPTKIK